MRVYFDSSALVCIYIAKAASGAIISFLESLRRPVLLNQLQDLEVRNSIRQKVVRNEIAEGMAVRCLRALDDDIIRGRIIRKPVVWEAAFDRAEALSQYVTNAYGLREPSGYSPTERRAVAFRSSSR